MFATPAAVLGNWFRGLIAVAVIVGGCWLLHEWYQAPRRIIPRAPANSAAEADAQKWAPAVEEARWHLGFDRRTAYLLSGVALLGWSLFGRFLSPRLLRRADARLPRLPDGQSIIIARGENAHVQAEVHGNQTSPTIIVTHGWGMDAEEWAYLRRQIGHQFRIVTWDLPGIGKSSRPPANDYSLERMAADLRAVIEHTSADRPVVLLGHSIGGMVILTFCRLFPELLGTPVSRLVLVHTTYTNPLETIRWSGLARALQKPLIEPLLHLQIALSPLVSLLNWLSYWNGSAHRSASRTSLAGTETRSQLDFVAAFQPRHSPAVLARGALAMLRYDAMRVLPHIRIPTLVVSGDRDPVTTPEANQRIGAEVPAGQVHQLLPAKHCGHIEHDRQFADQIAAFCREAAVSTPHFQVNAARTRH